MQLRRTFRARPPISATFDFDRPARRLRRTLPTAHRRPLPNQAPKSRSRVAQPFVRGLLGISRADQSPPPVSLRMKQNGLCRNRPSLLDFHLDKICDAGKDRRIIRMAASIFVCVQQIPPPMLPKNWPPFLAASPRI